MSQYPSIIELSSLNGQTGFRLDGIVRDMMSGFSVSDAGDINGDGIDDLMVGAYRANTNGDYSGATYVIFGSQSKFSSAISLATVGVTNHFRIDGARADDRLGFSVSSAGDVNGDGISDIVMGAVSNDPNGPYSNSGASYVVFGNKLGLPDILNVSSLNGKNGFAINGIADDDQSGFSVSGAGDVNGDGADDVIIGTYRADPAVGGKELMWGGQSYVVFGKVGGGFASELDLSALNGNNGFRLDGAAFLEGSGFAVSGAGDVNGDGFDDVLVGAYRAGAGAGGPYSGQTYVVFGKASGFASGFSLGTINGTNGFRIDGAATRDYSGFSVAAAGDVNGDGNADIFIGARRADIGGSGSGSSYIVFGKDKGEPGFGAKINLSQLTGANGFRIDGVGLNTLSGSSVASAGDVNGDGIGDMIIGAPDGGGATPGAAYVVFGVDTEKFAPVIKLSALNGDNGFKIDGVTLGAKTGGSVSAAGDINGDGFDDLVVGAYGGSPRGQYSGSTYVIFGIKPTGAVNRVGNDMGQTLAGGDHADKLSGLDGDDRLFGHAGGDTLDGGMGRDSMVGGAGADILSGSIAHDTLSGGDGNDVIDGGTGRDLISGGNGNDVLTGGAGRDRMFGGNGEDKFISGSSADAMAGGADADLFIFGAEAWGGDVISDFEDGADLLRFKRSVADGVEDFDIVGDGTMEVVISIGSQTLELRSSEAISLSNADFQFLA